MQRPSPSEDIIINGTLNSDPPPHSQHAAFSRAAQFSSISAEDTQTGSSGALDARLDVLSSSSHRAAKDHHHFKHNQLPKGNSQDLSEEAAQIQHEQGAASGDSIAQREAAAKDLQQGSPASENGQNLVKNDSNPNSKDNSEAQEEGNSKGSSPNESSSEPSPDQDDSSDPDDAKKSLAEDDSHEQGDSEDTSNSISLEALGGDPVKLSAGASQVNKYSLKYACKLSQPPLPAIEVVISFLMEP